jgi:hypothetical protein
MFKGTYQIRYTAKVCFPARDVIDGIAQAMAASHWDRLVYDPLNPGNKLSFALDRESKGGGAWWSTYPWKEFWKDKTGNVVYYRFAFDVDSPSPEAVHNSCSFKGVIIFYPKKTWELALKTLEDWRTKGAVNK